jgi:hypothetical protein
MPTTKKTSNRPIVSFVSAIESGDKKNLAARFVAFAGLKEAGATLESLSVNGAHFADLKEGLVIGWQGAAFWAKFDTTKEGKAILSGKVMDRFGGFEVVSKTKNDWSTDVSGKVGKMRKAYTDWLAKGAVPDAPKGAEDPAVLDPAAKPARAPNSKKALRDRIADDVTAMGNAILLDSKAKGDKGRQLTAEQAGELVNAFNVALTLVGVKKDKLIKQPAA